MINGIFHFLGEIDHKAFLNKEQIASLKVTTSSYFKIQGSLKYYMLLFSNCHSDVMVAIKNNHYNIDLYSALLIPPRNFFEIEAIAKHNDLSIIYFPIEFLQIVANRYNIALDLFLDYFSRIDLIIKNNWINEIVHRYFFEIYTVKRHTSSATDFLESEIIKETYYLGRDKNHKYCDRLNLDSLFLSGKSIQIKKILIYIESNLSSLLTLNEISSKTNIGLSTLKRKFSKELGISVHEYIQRRRLEDAYKILKSQKINVNEVSINLGFASTSSFIKLFKNMYGITPGKVTRANHDN